MQKLSKLYRKPFKEKDVSKDIAKGTYEFCIKRLGYSAKEANEVAKISERAWRPVST